MAAGIFSFLKALLAAIPVVGGYFKPKSVEQKVEESEAAVEKAVEEETKTGRPSAPPSTS